MKVLCNDIFLKRCLNPVDYYLKEIFFRIILQITSHVVFHRSQNITEFAKTKAETVNLRKSREKHESNQPIHHRSILLDAPSSRTNNAARARKGGERGGTSAINRPKRYSTR